MFERNERINAFGNWIHVLNFLALMWCGVIFWIVFPQFREMIRDIINAYDEIIRILEVFNG